MRRFFGFIVGLLVAFLFGASGVFMYPQLRTYLLNQPKNILISAHPERAATGLKNVPPPTTLNPQVLALQQAPALVAAPGSHAPTPRDIVEIPSRLPAHTGRSSATASLTIDQALSRRVTEGLHDNRLPFVNAHVFANATGELVKLVLSGQVRTDFGKRDAERKATDFLGSVRIRIENQIQVNLEVRSASVTTGSNSELELNPLFLGCWRGTNLRPDSLQWLGGCPHPFWVPDTWSLCLKRMEVDPGYAIIFQSATSAVPNFRSHTDLVSSDGSNRMEFRMIFSYDLGNGGSRLVITGTANCASVLVESRQVLNCRYTDFADCNNRPWTRTASHFEMHRVAR